MFLEVKITAIINSITQNQQYNIIIKIMMQSMVMMMLSMQGTLLKPNMVTSGTKCKSQADPQEVVCYQIIYLCLQMIFLSIYLNDQVASLTLLSLSRHVPPAVPGVFFLSGGQVFNHSYHRDHHDHHSYEKSLPLSSLTGQIHLKESDLRVRRWQRTIWWRSTRRWVLIIIIVNKTVGFYNNCKQDGGFR